MPATTAEIKLIPEQLSSTDSSLSFQGYDALLLVHNLPQSASTLIPTGVQQSIDAYQQLDASALSGVHLIPTTSDNAFIPGRRLILSATGPLNRDFDDVRRVADAARKAIKRAREAGLKSPLLQLALDVDFPNATQVALLGCLQELHEHLETIEWKQQQQAGGFVSTLSTIGFRVASLKDGQVIAQQVSAIEAGRKVARERMAAPRIVEYLKQAFTGCPNITVKVTTDYDELKKKYPLLAAVARASMDVVRHRPAVVRLEYRSPDQSQVKENLFLVGKGITYDTGGADLKVNGVMRGMSRDKGGAGGVAGFMKSVATTQPKHLNVTAQLALVRNSIGSESYVSDEIIVSRAGVRVLVGNTDAEGRMVMADLLAELKEEALALQSQTPTVNCRLFTVATLTGHVIRAYGPYPACLDNGPAKTLGTSQRLMNAGESMGEPWELSTLRREDYKFVAPCSSREDVVQANTAPSTMTSRGHQFPAAFLAIASGIAKHGLDRGEKKERIAYTHLDIAGAAEEEGGSFGSLPKCTGAPVVSLAAAFLQ